MRTRSCCVLVASRRDARVTCWQGRSRIGHTMYPILKGQGQARVRRVRTPVAGLSDPGPVGSEPPGFGRNLAGLVDLRDQLLVDDIAHLSGRLGREALLRRVVGQGGDLAVVPCGQDTADRLGTAEEGRRSPTNTTSVCAAGRVRRRRNSLRVEDLDRRFQLGHLLLHCLDPPGLLGGRFRALPGAEPFRRTQLRNVFALSIPNSSAAARNAADSSGYSPRTSAATHRVRQRSSGG